jgi:hypothetical protein
MPLIDVQGSCSKSQTCILSNKNSTLRKLKDGFHLIFVDLGILVLGGNSSIIDASILIVRTRPDTLNTGSIYILLCIRCPFEVLNTII